jgi:hypothetical protein
MPKKRSNLDKLRDKLAEEVNSNDFPREGSDEYKAEMAEHRDLPSFLKKRTQKKRGPKKDSIIDCSVLLTLC